MNNSIYKKLRQALIERDLPKIKLLLANGTDVDVKSSGGATSLHWCAENDYIEGAKQFLVSGSDIEAQNNKGWTPLFCAVREDNLSMATLLIENRADVTARDERQNTPIHMAHSREMVNLLIAHGADINASNKYSVLPWQSASHSAQAELIQRWLLEGGDPNHRFEFGKIPLHFVDTAEGIDILLSHGADINAHPDGAATALVEAVAAQKRDKVRLLLERQADMYIHWVMRPAVLCPDILLLLIEFGVDIQRWDGMGASPLHLATLSMNLESMRILLERGADVNANHDPSASHNFGRSPLHRAAQFANPEFAQLLLSFGADPNQKDPHGDTPLHVAVSLRFRLGRREQGDSNCDSEVIRLLIAHGADVNAEGMVKWTPLHTAVAEGSFEAVKILVENGADVNAQTTYSHDTPIRLAKKHEHREIEAFLLESGADAAQKVPVVSEIRNMVLTVPDEEVEIHQPTLEMIEEFVRKSFAKDGNATVLVVDEDKNLFIQSVGTHIEYNAYDGGPIYAVDDIDVDLAVKLYLSYAKGENWWTTAVDWQDYL